MIKQLTDMCTKAKAVIFGSMPLRLACYLIIAAILLIVWIYSEDAGVSFVYNEF